MVHTCQYCGKEYSHASGLSRHLNGNKSANIKPCSKMVDFIKVKNEETKKSIKVIATLQDIESARRSKPNTPPRDFFHPYTRGDDGIFPAMIELGGREKVLTEITMIIKSARDECQIYCTQMLNILHLTNEPNHWNVLMKKKREAIVSYYSLGAWKDISVCDFSILLLNTISNFLGEALNDLDAESEEKLKTFLKFIYVGDFEKAITKQLLGPRRDIIKRHNGF